MYTIKIFYADKKKPSLQLKRAKAGQTLLELFLANDIGIRHDCGGVCYCVTCCVTVEKGEAFIEEPAKRELDFLKRLKQRTANSRLACQCLLLEGSGEIEVALPGAQ